MKLEVRSANFSYQRGAENLYTEDLNFTLNTGDILTILGANGVGKTTLLRCLVGLLPWRSGESFFDEKSLSAYRKVDFWREVGYVPIARRSTFDLKVWEYVVLGRASYVGTFAQPSKRDRYLAEEKLEAVGIGHLAAKSSHQISSGELQLASIARTLVSDPKLLLLDEPESHLDIQKQVAVLSVIKKLAKEHGITSIINTHYPNHAFYLADRVLLLGKGLPVKFGRVADVMQVETLSTYFNVEVIKLQEQLGEERLEVMVPRALAKGTKS